MYAVKPKLPLRQGPSMVGIRLDCCGELSHEYGPRFIPKPVPIVLPNVILQPSARLARRHSIFVPFYEDDFGISMTAKASFYDSDSFDTRRVNASALACIPSRFA